MRKSKPYKIARAFFPLHVILGHIKYNLISLFYWTFLFLVISGSIASYFGAQSLFFNPEYHGIASGWSFAILGFSFGGFFMAFHTYGYIKLGPHYPFMGVISHPFLKFSINNSLIPLVFTIYYLIRMIAFQRREEFADNTTILVYSCCFLGGITVFILISVFYFFPVSTKNTLLGNTPNTPVQTITQKRVKWYNYFRQENEKVYYYISKGFKLQRSRPTNHLDQSQLEHIFAKNRINASIFELLSIITFISCGLFIEHPVFELPAAASIILLLTIIHMLFSAMMSWFHRWTYPIIFLVLGIMNYLSLHSSFFSYKNFAYGLDYAPSKIQSYNTDEIDLRTENKAGFRDSRKNILNILENWKKNTHQKKPKLIILNTSGGGSRSALWTFSVLQKTDHFLQGELTKHLNMITGASGGMVGAAYFREIYYRYQKKEITNRFEDRFTQNISKDLLNKLFFSASTTDIFFRYQTCTYNNKTYTRDRGYAFEQQLHTNTDFLMEHPLGYYKLPEQEALIPLMIFSPSIVNDGRRLLISAQSLRFITDNPKNYTGNSTYENIDYQSYFSENSPQDIRFSSVMRSSASFPFIMPMISMPSSPEIQLTDAGMRDNYGRKVSLEYLYDLQKWIKENTSGVIILEVRDTKRLLNNGQYKAISLLDKFTLPFGNVYNNFPRIQDYDQEQLLKIATAGFPFEVDIVSFNLRESEKDKISLSWHLSKQEKRKIDQAFYRKNNQDALKRLIQLLNH